MKKSKMFIALGTCVLAISAIFATKANKKFTSIHTAFWNSTSAGDVFLYTNSSNHIFTTAASGSRLGVAIYSRTGSTYVLKTSGLLKTKDNSVNVYYH